MKVADLVPVAVFASRPEAEVSRARLEAAGIEAVVRADDAGGYEPQLGLTNGVRVLVRAPYLAAAIGLLDRTGPGSGRRVPRWVAGVAGALAGLLVASMSLPAVVTIVRVIT